MSSADIVVVGGGIAGLSVAYALRLRGLSVTLLEQERAVATHSSGRNAAIFLPLDEAVTTAPLGLRTLELLKDLGPRAGVPLLRRSGSLLVSSEPARTAALARTAAASGLSCVSLGHAELREFQPALATSAVQSGLWLPAAGVLDIHALNTVLAKLLAEAGVRVRTRCSVERLVVNGERSAGVLLQDGEVLAGGAVVLAAGAWNATLARRSGVPLPLVPLRRHLVQLGGPAPRLRTVVWRLEDEVYFRPEATGVLASPCDEAPWAPGVPAVDRVVLERLAERLEPVCPALLRLPVRSLWACLRTFAPDQELVLGPDPRLEGLYWFGGLGGRGMSVGLGAGELLARQIDHGAAQPLDGVMAPARLLVSSQQRAAALLGTPRHDRRRNHTDVRC